MRAMDITQEKFEALQDVLYDCVSFYCDEFMVSGEMAWTLIQVQSIVELAKIRNEPISL